MTAATPDISAVESLYRRGDFAEARRLARAIAAAGDSPPSSRARADEILAATGIDPVAVGAFAVTALVLLFLVAHYVF
jgi:hypothetical protein